MGGESGIPAIPYCRSLSLLGERSAGTLYAADSDRYGGAVTVTVYPRPADDRARRRFEAAVETARRLGAHPNLVTIHASGHTDGDGRPYVVSDGHDRTTAAGVLATSGVLGVDSVLPIGVALAGALETGHRAGLVHGGVAPGLVLLRADGQPVLTEIGLYEFARPQGASAHLARWIPYHAPPEILEGTDVTPATDVYSLASVIYTLLVGQPPYAGTGVDDSTASLLLRILQMPMPPIERSDVPPGLEDVLRASLSHSPAKRPQHALELAWAMQEAQRTAGLEVTEPYVMDLGGSIPGAVAGGAAALGSPTLPEALPAPGTTGGPKDWSFLTPQPPAAGAAGAGAATGASVFGPPGGTPAAPAAFGTDGRPDDPSRSPWADGTSNGTPSALDPTDDASRTPWAGGTGIDQVGASPWAGGTGASTPTPLGRTDDASSPPWAGGTGASTPTPLGRTDDASSPPWAGKPGNGTPIPLVPGNDGGASSPWTDGAGNGTSPWADSGGRTDGAGSPPWASRPGNGTSMPLGHSDDGGTSPWADAGENGTTTPLGHSDDGGTSPWADAGENGTTTPLGRTDAGGSPPWASRPGNGTPIPLVPGDDAGAPSPWADGTGNGTTPWADSGGRTDVGGTSAWNGDRFAPGGDAPSPHGGAGNGSASPWGDDGGATTGASVFGEAGNDANGGTSVVGAGPSNGTVPTPLGGAGGVSSPSNGYGSLVAGSADGAPLPRPDAGSGARGVSTPADNGVAGALPRRGGTGDSPQTTTPWWATPPFGTTAVSGSPAPTTPAGGGGALGPLGTSRPNPLDSPVLHQPLPTDERPPIDTRMLGEVFEPARPARPALPNRPAVPQARQAPSPSPAPSPAPTRRRRGQDAEAESTAGPGDATSRRSRRGESRSRTGPGNDRPAAPSGPAATTDDDRPMSALERARLARIERQQRERAGSRRSHDAGQAATGATAAPTAIVAEPRPRPEAPADGSPTRRPIGATPDMAAARTGPPALPVIVLVVLVLVLGLGGAWMVVTGEDSPEPASEADEPAPDQETPTTEGTPAGQAAFTPNRASDLTAIETPNGVQLDWEGPEGSAYLVRILSPTEPPRPLGAGPATALLIPPDLVQPGGSYCFDVVAAPAEGEPPVSVPEDPSQVTFPTACIGGANAEAVIRP